MLASLLLMLPQLLLLLLQLLLRLLLLQQPGLSAANLKCGEMLRLLLSSTLHPDGAAAAAAAVAVAVAAASAVVAVAVAVVLVKRLPTERRGAHTPQI